MLEEINGDRAVLQEAEQRWIDRLKNATYNQRKALISPPVARPVPIPTDPAAASEAARALAALRPRATYQCVICGQPFEARVQGGQRAVRFCPATRCQNKRRELTRKPKP